MATVINTRLKAIFNSIRYSVKRGPVETGEAYPKIKFRSPLLAAMPQTETPRWLKYGLIIGFLGGLVVWLIYLMVAQPLSKNGLGYGLYWLHDNAFLPLKAYTFTQYYPLSWIWWGFIATVVVLRMFFLLTNKSIIRSLHLTLAKLAIRSPITRYAALRSPIAYGLRRLGFQPDLLKAAIEYERVLALNRLEASSGSAVNRKEGGMAVHLTQLLTELLLSRPASRIRHSRLEALTHWHQTFLLIQHKHDNHQKELISDLAANIENIVFPDLNYKNKAEFEKVRNQAAQLNPMAIFDPVAAQVDLIYLASLGNGKLAEQIFDGTINASPETRQQEVYYWLAKSVETRRVLLDHVYIPAIMEMLGWTQPGAAGSNLSTRVRRRFRILTAQYRTKLTNADIKAMMSGFSFDETNLPAVGRLSLGIALDLAKSVNDPDIALGYLNAIEALAFALEFAETDSNSSRSGLVKHLLAFISDLPRPEDYRLCITLARERFKQRQEEWERPPSFKGNTIETADFDLARVQVNSLCLAAEPDFN